MRLAPLLVVILCGTSLFSAGLAFGSGIIVFGDENRPPKIYLEDGQPKGLLVDILRQVQDQMGVTFTIILRPWARAVNSAKSGAGGILGFTKTWRQLKHFDYSDPIYHEDVHLVLTHKNLFRFQGLEDLKGKRLGLQRGAAFGIDYDEAVKRECFLPEEDNSPVQRLKKLLSGRIDGAFIGQGRTSLDSVLRQDQTLWENREQFVVLPDPVFRSPFCLAFPKRMQQEDLLRRFNEALQQARESGALQMIFDQYPE